jgi:hypothetical protein
MASLTSSAVEFRRFIGTCNPRITDLLKHDNLNVPTDGVKVLSNALEHGM